MNLSEWFLKFLRIFFYVRWKMEIVNIRTDPNANLELKENWYCYNFGQLILR